MSLTYNILFLSLQVLMGVAALMILHFTILHFIRGKLPTKLLAKIKYSWILYVLVGILSFGIEILFFQSECYATAINDQETQKRIEREIGEKIEYQYSGWGSALYNPGSVKATGEKRLGKAYFPVNFCGNEKSIKVIFYMSQDSAFAWQVDSTSFIR